MKVRPSPLLPSTVWSVQVSNTFLEVKTHKSAVPAVVTAPPQVAGNSPAARLRFQMEAEADPIVSTTSRSKGTSSSPIAVHDELESLPARGTTPVFHCPSSSRTASSGVTDASSARYVRTPNDLSPRAGDARVPFDQMLQNSVVPPLPESPERSAAASLPSLPSLGPSLASVPSQAPFSPQSYASGVVPPYADDTTTTYYSGQALPTMPMHYEAQNSATMMSYPRHAESKPNTGFSPYRGNDFPQRRPIKLDGLLWAGSEEPREEPDVQGAPMPPRNRAPPPPPGEVRRPASSDASLRNSSESSDDDAASETACDNPMWPEGAPRPPADAEHPSLGSEEHASGNCKRCCFFPRGRCQNGYDCGFCHYDHEKRRRKNKKRRAAAAERDGADRVSMERVSEHRCVSESCGERGEHRGEHRGEPRVERAPLAAPPPPRSASTSPEQHGVLPTALPTTLGSASDFLLAQLTRDIAERQWAEEQAAAILSKKGGGAQLDYATMKMPDNYAGKLIDDTDDTVLGRALRNGRL